MYSSNETSFGLLMASTSRSKVEDVEGFLSVLLPPPLIAFDRPEALSKIFNELSFIDGASMKSLIPLPPRILAANDLASDNSSRDPSSTGLNSSSKNWSTSEAFRRGIKKMQKWKITSLHLIQCRLNLPCDGTLTRRT